MKRFSGQTFPSAASPGQAAPLYHILVNPNAKSGLGRRIWLRTERLLKERNVRYKILYTKSSAHIAETVTRLTAHPGIRLIVIGGDGTLNCVLNSIVSFDNICLGFIPAGSGNDFARDFGLPKDPEIILDRILEDRIRHVFDVGRLICHSIADPDTDALRLDEPHSVRFNVGCGIGYDAAVCHGLDRSRIKQLLNRLHLGRLGYAAVALQELHTMHQVPCTITLDDTRTFTVDRLLSCATMIHRFQGGGFEFCPMADATDGVFDLCVAGNLSGLALLRVLPFLLKGKHFRFRGIEHYTAHKVEIRTGAPLHVQTDGEVVGISDHLTLTCEKQKLRMLV